MTRILAWFKRRPIFTVAVVSIAFLIYFGISFGYAPVWFREWGWR